MQSIIRKSFVGLFGFYFFVVGITMFFDTFVKDYVVSVGRDFISSPYSRLLLMKKCLRALVYNSMYKQRGMV